VLSLDEHRPPVPPADLILRVVPSFEGGDVEAARHAFDVEGFNNLRLFEHALAAVSPWHFGGDAWLGDPRVGIPRSFADFDRLLDFGCGCGRLLRHLGSIADQLEIHGTDIDAEMIDWLRSHMPFGRFEIAPHEPPLPYADHHFDVVIGHSVFSHLDERRQDLWLAELQRITRPDAVLLLTVEGPSTWARTCRADVSAGEDVGRWHAELESRGILFIENDAWVGSTHPDYYHSTIHAPWYVFDHWTRFFDVEAYLADGSWSQDLLVLRRRADGAPPSRPPIERRAHQLAVDVPKAMRATARSRLASLAARLGRRLQPGTRDVSSPSASELEIQHLAREIGMLRLGLYEQGRRISVLTEQLRDEIKALRNIGPRS
jgi:SAM-dependent methyltransferase